MGMAGYAATARITHVSPHRVTRDDGPPPSPAVVPSVEDEVLWIEDVSGRPFLAPLTDWWDDVRELWRQGMDVLRDPRIY
jgi:hypothetical protein